MFGQIVRKNIDENVGQIVRKDRDENKHDTSTQSKVNKQHFYWCSTSVTVGSSIMRITHALSVKRSQPAVEWYFNFH